MARPQSVLCSEVLLYCNAEIGYRYHMHSMHFPAECLIILAGAVWTSDLLPSDVYDSVWVAMVYKLTYVSNY